MDKFDNIFGKYKTLKGKFDSIYTIIVYNFGMQEMINKIEHQINLIKLIRDTFKRTYLLTKMYSFKDYLNGLQDVTVLNNIFIIHENIELHDIEPEWKNILIEFDAPKYIFKNSSTFEYEYIKNFLTDKTYFNVIQINNNLLTHYHFNETKRKLHKTEKFSDIQEYLKTHTTGTVVIHGVSSSFKDLKSDKHVVCNRLLRDEEIYDMHHKHKNKKIEQEVTEWLGNILHPKLGNRIVFGKDISKKISQKLLQKVYCTEDMSKKICEKIPQDYKIFETHVVKSYELGDAADILNKNYSGIIGITFY